MNYIKAILISTLLLGITSCDAQQKEPMQDPDYTQLVQTPPSLDPKRTEFKCATWAEPEAPDEASQRWYQAATTIHAKEFRTTNEEYQKMLILYEAAARKGHYKAIKNLIVLYNEGGYAKADQFPPEPIKARYWIHYGLNKQWAGAFEWLSNALHYGNAGYSPNETFSGAYLQKAADLGVPFAQFELAQIYGDRYDRREAKLALLACAAAQNFPPALDLLAINRNIDGFPNEALELYQRSVMGGGVRGQASALGLSHAFEEGEYIQEQLNTPTDPERAKAYYELWVAIGGTETTSGNIFFRFPRLNEVLPLPPAQMPPWKGVYSAMSKEDAAYYQNPPNPDDLIKEIINTEFMVPKGYLTQPIPYKQDLSTEGEELDN